MSRVLSYLVVGLWFALAGAAGAQDLPNFDRFDSFARSVETNIENDRLPDETFESLRDSLADWRDDFLAAQDTNSVQIEALEAQIEALGAPPAEGESEPATISQRREELGDQLREAMAPRIEAEEARARAEALIRQIDAILRGRQADAFFELGRTPLDPTLWSGAVAGFFGAVATV